MKKILDTWQVEWSIKKDTVRREAGWKYVSIGYLKLKSYPPEGTRLRPKHYQGFLWRWRQWLPFEADDERI